MFVEAINSVGLEISDQPIKIIIIDKEVVYKEGKKSISFKPSKISLEIDFEINFKDGVVEPRQSIQGDIARIYFYMSETYNVPLNKKLQKMLKTWSKLDPIDQKEFERNSKIFRIQGNSNPFVDAKQTIKNELTRDDVPATLTSKNNG